MTTKTRKPRKPAPNTQYVSRHQAEAVIESLRAAVINKHLPEPTRQFAQQLLDVYLAYDVDGKRVGMLAECNGDAHSNAFIDNCMCCAPRWGTVGVFVKVR
jgi:hypothetical protein